MPDENLHNFYHQAESTLRANKISIDKSLSIDSLTHTACSKESPTRPQIYSNMGSKEKNSKDCRNKKQSVAFLTPPDSPLSSSSGSLSSGNSERKQHPKRKPLRYKGHTMLIAIPKRKKRKTKKSSSGSDSDCNPYRFNYLMDEHNRTSLYSSCKSFYCLYSIKNGPRDE